jgi:peptidoglycan/LPS O-acetylase OafA/YrhL
MAVAARPGRWLGYEPAAPAGAPSPVNQPMTDSRRHHEIDLFRFSAALMVVLYHYTFRGHAADGYSPFEFPVLGALFRYGYLGVDLFFVISGFVILMSASRSTAMRFTISRMVRLYPAFWVCVTLTAACIVLFGNGLFEVGLAQYLANLTMVSGYVDVPPVDGVYWTLLVEMKFYLLVFVLLLFRQIDHIERYLAGWLALSWAALFIDTPTLLRAYLITDWSSYFIAGCTFYLLRSRGPSRLRWALLAGACGLSLYHAVTFAAGLEAHFGQPFSGAVVAGIVLGFYGLFLLVALGRTQWLNLPWLATLGALTYPLYLLHQRIGYVIFQHFADANRFVVLSATIALMLALAYLVHRLVERPLAPRMKQALSALVLRLPLLRYA